MTNKRDDRVLMDEDGIRITADNIETPDGVFAVTDILKASRNVHRPLWGPFLLASLGTLTLTAAVQTMFWGDWLASVVMLLGGIYWRIGGTRHVLVLEERSKKTDAWYARNSKQCDRALVLIQRTIDSS